MNFFQKLFSGIKQKSFSLVELSRAFGGGNTWNSTGLLEQYAKSVYVYACVDKISKYVSTIDLHLHQITGSNGDSKEVLNHPALDLMYKFNPFQTRSEFLRITMINKKLAGKAFWLKVRNERGQVVELWNIRPDIVQVIPDEENFVKGYKVMLPDGTFETKAPEDVIFLKDPNPLNIYDGLSPLSPAKSRIETEQNATDYQRDFFYNSARPDAILKTGESLTGEQVNEITSRWENRFKGKGKTSRIGVVYGGMEYQQLSLSNREMDYIESMKFTRDDILVAFGVPKSVVTTDDVNRANAEAGQLMFIAQTIKPEMLQLVEVLNEMLLVPEFGEQFYFTFTDPTPEDRAQKLNEYTQGVDKWVTRNEIRGEIGLEPVVGGDELFGSLVNVPIGSVQEMQDQSQQNLSVFNGKRFLKEKFQLIESAGKLKVKTNKKKDGIKIEKSNGRKILEKKELRKNYLIMIDKIISRKAKIFKSKLGKEVKAQEARVIEKIQRQFKSKEEKLSPSDLGSILNIASENKLIASFTLPFITEFLRTSGQDGLNLLNTGKEFNLTQVIQQRLEKRAGFFADSINSTTFKKLSNSLSEGIAGGEGIADLSKRVGDIYDQYSDYRLEMIARTESTYANNQGFIESYQQSNVVSGKEWIATLDDRTRDEHVALDGEVVEINASFSNGLSHPEEPNCRCVVAPVIKD